MQAFMKNFYILILLLLLVSCKESVSDKTEVNSQKNVPQKVHRNDEVYIAIEDTTESFSTNLRLDEFQDKTDLIAFGKENRRISITIPTKKSISLIGGNLTGGFFYDVELEKGDSVYIKQEKIKISPKESIKIAFFDITNSDRKPSEINFPNLLYRKHIKTGSKSIDTSKSFLWVKWDSQNQYFDALQLLDSLKRTNKISDKFYEKEKGNQKWEYLARQIREKKIEFIDSSKLIKTNGELFPVINSEIDSSPKYISFLRALIDYQYLGDRGRMTNSDKFEFVRYNETFLNQDLKIKVLDAYLKSIYFIEKEKFPEFVNRFKKINGDNKLSSKWENILTTYTDNLHRLNSSKNDVALLTNMVNDNELTFDEIIKELNGKVVLVDFWASWCAPCRMEMPQLEKVKEQFDETKFQIVEISIDDDYNAWERASQIENLSDEKHSYHISNWKKSNLYKNYNINTIPRYILIDKNGKIINADAPRPSNSLLADLIQASI